MNIIQSLCGTLLVEITSAEPEITLEQITLTGISITGVTKITELIYQFRIFRKDYSKLSQILQKRECKLTILRKQGIYWKMRALLGRPILIFTICIMLLLTFFLPTRILFIEAEGNRALTEGEILSAAEACGISFGTSRKYVRSERVKNELLSLLPKLQWAGINTAGCRAVISVRERAEAEEPPQENIVSNLISDRDAFILSTTVTKGTALVHPGDTVTEGQTLISGYADHGFRIEASRASGEILGLTNRTLKAVMPAKHLRITDREDVKHKISLLIRKKRINLWKDSRISDACCGRMYEEYFVSLPGGFQLPVAICVDRYFSYETEENVSAEEEACQKLQLFSEEYLGQQMVAGLILQKYHQIAVSDDTYLLTSNYTCSEMIGREQREQIGDHDGKRN